MVFILYVSYSYLLLIALFIWSFVFMISIDNFFNTAIQYMDQGALYCGLLSIILIILEKRLGWLFAAVASLLSSVMYFGTHVYFHSILSLYYVGISVYGFILWKDKKSTKKLQISEYPFILHVKIILITTVISILMALIVQYIINPRYVIFDALVFSFAIIANYMQVKKIVSNWIYWIVLDSIVFIMDIKLGFVHLSYLNIAYVILAFVGFFRYTRRLKKLRLVAKK